MLASFVVVLAAALFGAGDQYLGSLGGHGVPWADQVSLLSAPWLVLAFLAGCTQRDPRRAAAIGLAATLSALVGYGFMTLSPVENAHLSLPTVTAFGRSELRVIVGGVITGPLCGWSGQRWRVAGGWLGAVAVAAAVCLEPLARIPAGYAIASAAVWQSEVGVGIAMTLYVALTVAAWRRSGRRRTAAL